MQQRNDDKEKPDAAGAAPSQVAVGSDSISNLQHADPAVQVARFASERAQRNGKRGSYVVMRPDDEHEPDVEIWWVSAHGGSSPHRIACSLRDGTLMVTGDAKYSHQPLIEMGDAIMGDDFCTIEGVRQ